MPDTIDLNETLKELSRNTPILLDNKTCVYCGIPLSPQNDTKEHVIGRRFVPKGKLDGQWNLIVRACNVCNGKKSDLENDISAITMHTDASGKHSVADETLSIEAKRKAANSLSRRTWKFVCESSEKIKVEVPFGPGAKFTFSLSAPPQIDEDRVYELALMQVRAFFYLISYDIETMRGRLWPGAFFEVLQSPRSDWGNPIHRHFMGKVLNWEHRVFGISADGFFKIEIRRHPEAVCWSWALEWNQNYRVIGFFGEEAPVRAALADFPKSETSLIVQGPNQYSRFRAETTLNESDDCLFKWENS